RNATVSTAWASGASSRHGVPAAACLRSSDAASVAQVPALTFTPARNSAYPVVVWVGVKDVPWQAVTGAPGLDAGFRGDYLRTRGPARTTGPARPCSNPVIRTARNRDLRSRAAPVPGQRQRPRPCTAESPRPSLSTSRQPAKTGDETSSLADGILLTVASIVSRRAGRFSQLACGPGRRRIHRGARIHRDLSPGPPHPRARRCCPVTQGPRAPAGPPGAGPPSRCPLSSWLPRRHRGTRTPSPEDSSFQQSRTPGPSGRSEPARCSIGAVRTGETGPAYRGT